MHEISVVAFDLDDTLIRLSPNFVPEYIQLLANAVEAAFPAAAPVAQSIVRSSERMMAKERDVQRLEEFFYRDFVSQTGLPQEALAPVFAAFYRDTFPTLQRLSRPVYGAVGLLAGLRAQGYRVALLTSALFPAEAISQRLLWAGLEDVPFEWQTSLEAMHATKPNPAFYEEAAERLGVDTGAVLMVGNDWVEDIIPARRAGMQVYWVHDGGGEDRGCPGGSVLRVLPWLTAVATTQPVAQSDYQ